LVRHQVNNIRLSLAYVQRLEEQELTQGDFPDFDGVNHLEVGFFRPALSLGVLLLDLHLSVLVFGAGEQKIVRFVHFEVVARLERVNHSPRPSCIEEWSLLKRAECQDVDSISIEHDEVLVFVEQDTYDLRLPELEPFVSKDD